MSGYESHYTWRGKLWLRTADLLATYLPLRYPGKSKSLLARLYWRLHTDAYAWGSIQIEKELARRSTPHD